MAYLTGFMNSQRRTCRESSSRIRHSSRRDIHHNQAWVRLRIMGFYLSRHNCSFPHPLPFRWSHHGSVREGFEASLKSLDVGYIDLYLMHWPQAANEKGKSTEKVPNVRLLMTLL